jgi:S-adenosylmethionine hydrolase
VRDICFLSDYGYGDDFAGVCRAVVRRLAPGVVVIDVSHGIPPRDVTAGAVVLRNTLPYMPEAAVHLAIVDPGVGGPRRAVAARSRGGRLFVGPDNGLLPPAVEADGGVSEVVELTEPELWLEPVSATFHGRDIFAPVAARLAAGTPLSSAGPAIDESGLVRLDPPDAGVTRAGLRAPAALIDQFGNVALDCTGELLARSGLEGAIEIECGGQRFHATVARTFSSVRPGDLVVLIDSYGQVAVCVRDGSASEVMSVGVGDLVELRRLSVV